MRLNNKVLIGSSDAGGMYNEVTKLQVRLEKKETTTTADFRNQTSIVLFP